MDGFIETFQRVNIGEQEALKKGLKDELYIEDAYNPFEDIE